MFRWEWLLIELLVLGALIYELVSVTRSARADRAKAKAAADAAAPAPPDNTRGGR